MERDFKQELEKIDTFIDDLGKIASSDGKVTQEEQSIMDEIMSELSDYRLLVMDALEDGEVDQEENTKMRKALDRIVDNASKIALSDGKYSSDEERLIESLISFSETNK